MFPFALIPCGTVGVSSPSTWTIEKDPAASGTLSGRTFTAREDDGSGFVKLHMPFTAVLHGQYRLRFDTTGANSRGRVPENSIVGGVDLNASQVIAGGAQHVEVLWTSNYAGDLNAAIWVDATVSRTITDIYLERLN